MMAKNLKGHLLLAHGTMDNNVPPYNTLLVVDALIKANKDFDLLMLPNQAHGYGSESNYMMRRRWDYFVRYLLGAEPPHEYEMHPPAPARGGSRNCDVVEFRISGDRPLVAKVAALDQSSVRIVC